MTTSGGLILGCAGVVEVVVGSGGGAGGGVDTRFSAGACQVVDVVDGSVVDVVGFAGLAAFVVGRPAGIDLTVVVLLGATGVAAVVGGSDRRLTSGFPTAPVEAAGPELSDARLG